MIEIPGYRVLKPLGNGGVATVYLARRESDDHDVAIKVMTPTLLADPEFGSRFLREARMAAKLAHRNIAAIHDVGHIGTLYYVVMEHLAGGPLLARPREARPPAFALRVAREIANALAYVHDQGFVHRDVKTDNVLLRDDGSAALTDFGIARAHQATARITLAGTVIGTPHYMSPEQARGESVDGRADLYALGIILHEMLTGRVPYDADDSVMIGLRHIDDPLPQLPRDLVAVQPLLDRLLAKQASQRFQNGRDVVAAIAQLESKLATASRDQPDDDATAFFAATNNDPLFDSGARPQPALGTLDELESESLLERAPVRRRGAKPSRKGALGFVVLAIIAVVAMGTAWFHQDRLRELIPETQLNQLLQQGQQSLDAGRISGSPDAALESFRRARELEEDNEVARNGLNSVAARLLDQGQQALARNDLASARQSLETLRDLRGGGVEVDTLAQAIGGVESGRDDEAELLTTAEAALAAGRINGSNGAIAAYRKLENSEHGSAIAKSGLGKAGKVLEGRVDAALAAGELGKAAGEIDDLASEMPEYAGLADVRGRLAAARERVKQDIESTLATAQQRLRDGDVTGGTDSALALYRRVLAIDAGNRAAKEGLRRVAQALLVSANAALEDRDINSAARLIDQVAGLAPTAPDLRQAQSRLRDLRESREIDAERTPLDAAAMEEVRQLLVQARAAARRGALMDPPRASAYDYYRAALAIDPDSTFAADGLRQLPELALARYRERYRDGDLSAALAELDVMRQLAPESPALVSASSRLLDASLERAASLIGERRLGDAQRALDVARELDPGNPGLADLEREAAMLRRDY